MEPSKTFIPSSPFTQYVLGMPSILDKDEYHNTINSRTPPPMKRIQVVSSTTKLARVLNFEDCDKHSNLNFGTSPTKRNLEVSALSRTTSCAARNPTNSAMRLPSTSPCRSRSSSARLNERSSSRSATTRKRPRPPTTTVLSLKQNELSNN
jgi:hypothetical protein